MEDIIYIEIGKLIKKTRLLRNLTQQELSESINITRASIANIERGSQKISLYTLYQVAESLDVSPKSLLPEVEVLTKSQKNLNTDLDNLKERLTLKELEWVYQIKKKTENEGGLKDENKKEDRTES
ncbi:helix-turn-helix domain-containing protein [Cytobacillus oceanisediminis]|uniref:HTH cro/C1-type domain-containing protein n=1 Tax=Cytobacillus oceanisediminis 2691 TaxID=1196031 RepID=A0A160ME84_9BACI|nr:helix-turn-helix transcriptional regulator [Cytobacillus oceanisediminis]AND41439.1 hypothetical protein A361_20490 [Cytobacillus oceanisediminis 2691]